MTAQVTYQFTNGTIANAEEVNQNFTDAMTYSQDVSIVNSILELKRNNAYLLNEVYASGVALATGTVSTTSYSGTVFSPVVVNKAILIGEPINKGLIYGTTQDFDDALDWTLTTSGTTSHTLNSITANVSPTSGNIRARSIDLSSYDSFSLYVTGTMGVVNGEATFKFTDGTNNQVISTISSSNTSFSSMLYCYNDKVNKIINYSNNGTFAAFSYAAFSALKVDFYCNATSAGQVNSSSINLVWFGLGGNTTSTGTYLFSANNGINYGTVSALNVPFTITNPGTSCILKSVTNVTSGEIIMGGSGSYYIGWNN